MSDVEALSCQSSEVVLAEQALINRAQIGETAAFGELFATYRDKLLIIANSRAGYNDGEDVVQNAAIKTFRGIGGFEDRTGTGIVAWLATAVRRAVIDNVRYERARPVEYTEDLTQLLSPDELTRVSQTQVDNPEIAALKWDSYSRVEAAFAALPPARAKLFRAIYLDGLTLGEYSEREGITVGTAKSAHSRGKAQLAQLIASGEIDLGY
jgi:RNA polymerase sigma-70 factor (ECF subfamily)